MARKKGYTEPESYFSDATRKKFIDNDKKNTTKKETPKKSSKKTK